MTFVLKRWVLGASLLFALCAFGRSLCFYYLIGDDDRTLQVKVDYDGKIVHGRIVDPAHPEEPIRALFLGRVSDDGSTFISDARDTQPSDRRRGFQRLLTEEVSRAFPKLRRFKANLQDDNAIAFFLAVQSELGVKEKNLSQIRDEKLLAIETQKLLAPLSSERRSSVLSRAAKATPDHKLALELIGSKSRVLGVDLKIDEITGTYSLDIEVVNELWN